MSKNKIYKYKLSWLATISIALLLAFEITIGINHILIASIASVLFASVIFAETEILELLREIAPKWSGEE